MTPTEPSAEMLSAALVRVLQIVADASTEARTHDRLILRALEQIVTEQARQAIDLALLTTYLGRLESQHEPTTKGPMVQ